MPVKIDARCTQCASKEFGDPSKNSNYHTYSIPEDESNFGGGRHHGTENLYCPSCEEETVHNRCASSVPSEGQEQSSF